MDLRQALLAEHSKNQAEKIITWIGGDAGRISQLIHIFMHDEHLVVQRAAWIVSGVAVQHPDLMQPHIPSLVKRLQDKGIHDAVKRHVLRLFQYTALPEAIHADLMNSCFDALSDPKEAPAVRAFAMTVLARLALLYPELNNELVLILEDALRHEQLPSFKSRAKKILQQIKKAAS